MGWLGAQERHSSSYSSVLSLNAMRYDDVGYESIYIVLDVVSVLVVVGIDRDGCFLST